MQKFSAIVPLAILVALTACNSVSRAPKGSPRVELEVAINLDPSYRSGLEAVTEGLERAIADTVLQNADVGLRFYPVLSNSYAPEDPRPEYLMTVDVKDLNVELGHRTISQKESDPYIEWFVKSVHCNVATVITKRRASGPPLVVARSEGNGIKTASIMAEDSTETTFEIARTSEERPPLHVAKTDLLRTTEHGLSKALAQLVVAVDRDLAMPPGSQPGMEHAAAPDTSR